MLYSKKFFYSPGGEIDGGVDITAHHAEDPKEPISEDADEKPETDIPAEETGEEKPVIGKIREALQDWANKDEADQEFDDNRV